MALSAEQQVAFEKVLALIGVSASDLTPDLMSPVLHELIAEKTITAVEAVRALSALHRLSKQSEVQKTVSPSPPPLASASATLPAFPPVSAVSIAIDSPPPYRALCPAHTDAALSQASSQTAVHCHDANSVVLPEGPRGLVNFPSILPSSVHCLFVFIDDSAPLNPPLSTWDTENADERRIQDCRFRLDLSKLGTLILDHTKSNVGAAPKSDVQIVYRRIVTNISAPNPLLWSQQSKHTHTTSLSRHWLERSGTDATVCADFAGEINSLTQWLRTNHPSIQGTIAVVCQDKSTVSLFQNLAPCRDLTGLFLQVWGSRRSLLQSAAAVQSLRIAPITYRAPSFCQLDTELRGLGYVEYRFSDPFKATDSLNPTPLTPEELSLRLTSCISNSPFILVESASSERGVPFDQWYYSRVRSLAFSLDLESVVHPLSNEPVGLRPLLLFVHSHCFAVIPFLSSHASTGKPHVFDLSVPQNFRLIESHLNKRFSDLPPSHGLRNAVVRLSTRSFPFDCPPPPPLRSSPQPSPCTSPTDEDRKRRGSSDSGERSLTGLPADRFSRCNTYLNASFRETATGAIHSGSQNDEIMADNQLVCPRHCLCESGLNCLFNHSEAEQRIFRTKKRHNSKAKTALCKFAVCRHAQCPDLCAGAHGEADGWCAYCGKTGHLVSACPWKA